MARACPLPLAALCLLALLACAQGAPNRWAYLSSAHPGKGWQRPAAEGCDSTRNTTFECQLPPLPLSSHPARRKLLQTTGAAQAGGAAQGDSAAVNSQTISAADPTSGEARLAG